MNKIEFESAKLVFTQDADGNSLEVQALEVSVEDCGGGKYFVLKTDRWAFDSLEELAGLLSSIRAKLGDWMDDGQEGIRA